MTSSEVYHAPTFTLLRFTLVHSLYVLPEIVLTNYDNYIVINNYDIHTYTNNNLGVPR